MGWNNVCLENKSKGKDFPSLNDNDFYFVHSYRVKNTSNKYNLSTTTYGEKFISLIEFNNIFATQFHPEKSQLAGLELIKNFIKA